ncbi:hypothetical protein CPC16_003653 [Podila verticillata]|nr:hypothetical protein CPC16_003653 [Podila verticillata]
MFLKVAGNLGTGNGVHTHQLKEHHPKEIKTNATIGGNVEEINTDGALKSDIDETDTDGALGDDSEETDTDDALEDDSEEADSDGALEDDSEEMDIDGTLEDDSEEMDTDGALEDDIDETDTDGTLEDDSEETDSDGAREDDSEETDSDGAREDDIEEVERFGQMDQTKFWKLASGRTVEQVLFEKSIKGGASFKIRSYTIDFACDITKQLFSEEEWTEVLFYNEWELPDLDETTWNYLDSVCATLQEGKHPSAVPFPADNWTSCNLILRTALAWMDLYRMKPCPLDNPSVHSEAFWARHGWPALKDLLNGIDGITMLDGEKFSLESTQLRNKNRRLDVEVKTQAEKKATRKAAGNKLDLIARDTLNHRDWCVGEAKKDWDELSTEHLKHTAVDLFKKLRLISIYRCKERGTNFRNEARFFSFFSGASIESKKRLYHLVP